MDNSNNSAQNGMQTQGGGYMGPAPEMGGGQNYAGGQMVSGYMNNGQVVAGQMNNAQMMGGQMVVNGQMMNGMNVQDQQKVLEELRARKKGESLTGMIILFVVGLLAVVFFGLFIWMFIQWERAKTNVEGQVQQRVDLAVKNNTESMNKDFREREKNPLRRFSGPIDYGELSFEYPKTWSLYVVKNAKNGGDFEAIFNPISINLQGQNETEVQALRLNIMNANFDSVVKKYDDPVKKGRYKLSVMQVGGNSANVYVGKTEKGKSVKIVIFPIRDKTVYIMTDSEKQYGSDFNKILKSITYNK